MKTQFHPQSGYLRLICLMLLSLISTLSSAGVTIMSQQELLDKQAKSAPLFVLDVRSPGEFAAGHVPHAINIPHTEVAQNIAQVKQAVEAGKEVVVYCHSGRRAGYAEQILQRAGISSLRHLDGDMMGWRAKGRPIEK